MKPFRGSVQNCGQKMFDADKQLMMSGPVWNLLIEDEIEGSWL